MDNTKLTKGQHATLILALYLTMPYLLRIMVRTLDSGTILQPDSPFPTLIIESIGFILISVSSIILLLYSVQNLSTLSGADEDREQQGSSAAVRPPIVAADE